MGKEKRPSKVQQRRNKNINIAASKQDWKEVSRLLDQPLENLLRKDRDVHLSSLNHIVSGGGRNTELVELIADNSSNPEEVLLMKERSEYLYRALQALPKDDYIIVMGIILEGKSALQLTKETNCKSHKTVQAHYKRALQLLKDELENYF
jgi:hypothetical protein